MKLTDSDILAAARELRDEQNQHLNVAPCPIRHRRMPTPLWWSATAAAVVVAFFVGRSLNPAPIDVGVQTKNYETATATTGDHSPLLGRGGGGEAALPSHDTIYLTRVVHVPSPVLANSTSPHLAQNEAAYAMEKRNAYSAEGEASAVAKSDSGPLHGGESEGFAPAADTMGCSLLCDDIRYDLLAVN